MTSPARSIRAALLSSCLAMIAACGAGGATPTAGPTLGDLSSVTELQNAFNQDSGKTRIVLLLSPT